MRKSILFLAAVAMMFVFASCGGNSPKDVAKDAAEMMKTGDYDGLVDLMAFDDEGMTKEECSLSLGAPRTIDRMPTRAGLYERWVYVNGVMLVFENGLLTQYRQ